MHLDGERHQRRRESQRAALVVAVDERPDAHPEASAVRRHVDARRRRPPRGCGRRRWPAAGAGGAEVPGRGWCAAGASAQPARRVATSTVATRSAVTRNRDVSGSGWRRHEALHRRLVVVDEAVRRPWPCIALRRAFGSSPARDSARAFSMTWSGACTQTWPSGSKPGRPARPASWWNSRAAEPPDPGAVELGERGHQHGADRDVDADAERVGPADHRQQPLRRRDVRRDAGTGAASRRGGRRPRCGSAGRACRRSPGPSERRPSPRRSPRAAGGW